MLRSQPAIWAASQPRHRAIFRLMRPFRVLLCFRKEGAPFCFSMNSTHIHADAQQKKPHLWSVSRSAARKGLDSHLKEENYSCDVKYHHTFLKLSKQYRWAWTCVLWASAYPVPLASSSCGLVSIHWPWEIRWTYEYFRQPTLSCDKKERNGPCWLLGAQW